MALWRETMVAVKVLHVLDERKTGGLDEEFPEDQATVGTRSTLGPFVDALTQVRSERGWRR